VGEESGFRFSGRSIVAGPGGEVVAQAGPADETMLVADCDLERIEEARRDGDYLADRRPELYAALVGGNQPVVAGR
jgi:N-carbamoylputrescine amidase